jgi:probable rRNA maturation factor
MARKSRSEDEIEIDVEIEPSIAPEVGPDVSEERLRAVGEAVLHQEGVPGQATLVITGDERIQELNRVYRGLDEPTDVLSFSAQEGSGDFVAAPEASCYLGDVIVSYPRAVAQAADQGHAVEQELNLLIVHGLLHLLGYDHAEEEEKAVMWARQEAILHSL